MELLEAFEYYLRVEELHLWLLDGHPDEAQTLLAELHRRMNISTLKSRSYFSGLMLYLKLDLQQSMFGLMLKGLPPDKQVAAFEGHYLASHNEIDKMELRIEVNRLFFQFFSIINPSDKEQFNDDIKVLESKVHGAHTIKVELELLKLLVYIESFQDERKDLHIVAVKNAAEQSNRNSDLLRSFLKKLRKADFTTYDSVKKEVPKLAAELEPLRNDKNHIDNIIMYWLNQFQSRK